MMKKYDYFFQIKQIQVSVIFTHLKLWVALVIWLLYLAKLSYIDFHYLEYILAELRLLTLEFGEVSSNSSHHPQKVLFARISLRVPRSMWPKTHSFIHSFIHIEAYTESGVCFIDL